MKKYFAPLFFAALLSQAQAQTALNTSEAIRLVSDLLKANPAGIDTAADRKFIVVSADFLALKNLVLGNWSSTIDNWDQITADNVIGGQFLFLIFEELPAVDFIALLEKIAELPSDSKTFKSAAPRIFDGWGKMRGFLADNYQHPRVVALLNKLKPHFESTTSTGNNITRLLSGQAKADIDNFREAHVGLPEGNIPTVLLPSN